MNSASSERVIPAKIDLHTKPLSFFATLKAVGKNVLNIIPDIATRQPMVSGTMALRWHMAMDPTALRRVMIENVENYPKSAVTKNLLRPAIGDSMFNAEGAHWRWQRQAAAPTFSARNILGLSPIMTAAAAESVDRLSAHIGKQTDVVDEMVRATFTVISDVTFSDTTGVIKAEEVHRALDAYLTDAAKVSILDMLNAPEWVPRPMRLLQKRQINKLKSLTNDVIHSRRTNGKRDIPDLLDMLIAGVDPETKRQMNNKDVRDNLLAFIVAGHETTSLALSWALYLLALHPDIQDRARQEAQSVLQGRICEGADVAQLPYIRQIIDETMRLYPPAPLVSRTALQSDTLCGREIRKRDTLIIPIYAIHRHHLYWKDPDYFDPDRFADRKSIERFSYLPFGDGPRICIGASFAIQEAVIILSSVLSKLKFTWPGGPDPVPTMILTLRPEGGLNLGVEAA